MRTLPTTIPDGPYTAGAVCVVCGATASPEHTGYTCDCVTGEDISGEGILDIRYDYAAALPAFSPSALALEPYSMWRYRALMPLPLTADVPPLHAGWTPLYESPVLALELGVARVLIKDETRQPSASLKDRASALAVAQARALGTQVVAGASTGNAAAALAGMAAAMGSTCVIFVPASAPPAKLAQLLAYGATVFTVQGTYDDAFDLCMAACNERGWYNRNTGFNPSMSEGKKTCSLEIAEQMGWQVPDRVFVGVGDGCIIGGLHKGFADLHAMGITEAMPRMMGVQAAGSDYLYRAWTAGADVNTLVHTPAIAASTAADSISAGLPRDRVKALGAVTDTDGAYLRVEDADILAAIPTLGRATGVFAEPAGAASLAGAFAARDAGMLGPHETVCLVVTGSGLKDVASATRASEFAGLSAIFVPLGDAGLTATLAAVPTD